jgi:hypothetical protein
MPTIELTDVELWGVLSAVSDEIEETQGFIADTDDEPDRIDRVRALRDLEVLESAKKKLERPHAND